MIRIILGMVLLSTVLLGGCVTSKQFQMDYQPKNISTSYTLVDKRPEMEKQAENLSVNVLSDKYGIFRVGDKQVMPDRMIFLRERLEEKSRSLLSGKTVTVNSFSIFNDMQTMTRHNASVGMFGMVAAIIDSAAEQYSEAYIETTLDITLNNQPYSAQVRNRYLVSKLSGIDDKVLAEGIKQSIDNVVDVLLKNVNNPSYAYSQQRQLDSEQAVAEAAPEVIPEPESAAAAVVAAPTVEPAPAPVSVSAPEVAVSQPAASEAASVNVEAKLPEPVAQPAALTSRDSASYLSLQEPNASQAEVSSEGGSGGETDAGENSEDDSEELKDWLN